MEEFYVNEFNAEKVNAILEEWGVCVVVNYFTRQQAATWKQQLVQWLCGLSKNKLKESKSGWKDEFLPAGPRFGMFQSLISNAPTYWDIREALYPLYKELHDDEELITSLDGASVFPPINKTTKPAADWAHIDQTIEGIKCVQGQVVLSDSRAAFRCTPTSHKYHHQILELCNAAGRTSNWLKFSQTQIKKIKEMMANDDLWQMPIHSPAGSVILWRSNTIHSSTAFMYPQKAIQPLTAQWIQQANDENANSNNDNVIDSFGEQGWRVVLYICMRPKKEFSFSQLATLRNAAMTGRTTNHWGTKVFPQRSNAVKHPDLKALLMNPKKIAPKSTQLSTTCKRLIGIENYDNAKEEQEEE